jgi:STE24 endopeptidase
LTRGIALTMWNPYFIAILVALLARFSLDALAGWLNQRALRPETPSELAGVYPPEEYRRSQAYTRAVTRFGFISDAVRLALLLAFWLSGGFNYLDILVRGWNLPLIPSSLIYIAILWLTASLFTLPFSIYGTFNLEVRFGFNRTTRRLFTIDLLKGFALSGLIGAPLLAGLLALFIYTGTHAWLYAWAGAVLFTVMMQFVAPIWIMPLFNKFTPMPEGELQTAILDYARSVGYRINRIYIMDGSRRSSKANAFLTGFGKTKRIALFDTLIAQHTTLELVAVLAHEVGHARKRHILWGMVISILQLGLFIYLLSFFLGSSGLYQAFYMVEPSLYVGLICYLLLYTPLEIVISLGLGILSRRHEYEADRFAAATAPQPESLITALKKLAANNLSNLAPHPFYVFLKYSHPPLRERLRAIRQYIGKVRNAGIP